MAGFAAWSLSSRSGFRPYQLLGSQGSGRSCEMERVPRQGPCEVNHRRQESACGAVLSIPWCSGGWSEPAVSATVPTRRLKPHTEV